MNPTWNYIKQNKLGALFNLIVFLILLLPYSITREFNLEIGGLSWESNFVFLNTGLIIPYLPLLVLTITYQIVKNKKLRNAVFILLIILSCLYSAGAFLSLTLVAQDYHPSFGNLLMVIIGPLSLWMGISTDHYIVKTMTKA